MSRRVLVTGSAGFLGRHICRILRERGDTPIGLDVRGDDDAPYMQVVGSVTDLKAWETAREVDAVVHTAALSGLWHPDPTQFDVVNRGGCSEAARYAVRNKIPLVIISSYTVLMAVTTTEETALTGAEVRNPDELIGPYAQAKRRGEIEALEIDPSAVILRPTALIGPGDDGPTPPMAMLRDVALAKLPGVMAGRINVVDVRDVAKAVLSVLDHPQTEGPYLISGYDLSLKAFAEQIARVAGVSPPMLEVPTFMARFASRADHLLAGWQKRDVKAPRDGVELALLPVTFDASKAKAEIGFGPRPLEETIKDAVAYVQTP
ncbi:MAG: NAD-dependent epimerase/dehydratase family protein [Pseudomonadota bacterium]